MNNFSGNISRNAVSIGIISVIFLVFATYLLIISNFNNAFSGIAGNLKIFVYMKNETPTKLTQSTQDELSKIQNIKSVKLQSKSQAFDKFKNLFGGTIKDISTIKNPFPVSYEMNLLKNLSYSEIKIIVSKIQKTKNAKYIEEIDYGSKWLENALSAFKAFKKSGVFFLAILFSGLFMIVYNTHKLIFIARKQEIEILRIMGATKKFIMLPYLLESAIIGLISSAASLTLLYLFWNYLKREIMTVSFLFSGTSFLSAHEITAFAIIGIALVILSAFVSILTLLREIR
jgi:cell division transport system permease protein